MAAAAHNPSFAKKVGIPVSVAKEFNQADKGKKFKEGGNVANLKKLFKGKETYSEELKEGKAIKSGKLTPQQYAKGEKMEESKKMKAGGKKMKGGGNCMAKGGVTRADGCATKGHTKGKMMAKGGSTTDDNSSRDDNSSQYVVKNGKIYANDTYGISDKYESKKGRELDNYDMDVKQDRNLRALRTNALRRAHGTVDESKHSEDAPKRVERKAKELGDTAEALQKVSKYNASRDIVDKINPEGGSSRGNTYQYVNSKYIGEPDEFDAEDEKYKKGGKVKSCGMKGGGVTRGDGIASRGRTRGKFV